MKWIAAGAFALCLGLPAQASVVSSANTGFEVRHSVNLVVPTDIAFSAFGEIGRWWDKGHTYSGDSANMSLELAPGSCFCERLPAGGGIEHMRVAYVKPGERVVLTGALGPLLFEAVNGVMDVKVERIAGGSRVTMSYKASGFANGGAAKLAPLVDQVLAEQMRRYRAYAAARPQTR